MWRWRTAGSLWTVCDEILWSLSTGLLQIFLLDSCLWGCINLYNCIWQIVFANTYTNLVIIFSLVLRSTSFFLSSLQFSVRSLALMGVDASGGTCAGVHQTQQESFATCLHRLLPDQPLTATRTTPTKDPNLLPTPCTHCHCPINKVITELCKYSTPLFII